MNIFSLKGLPVDTSVNLSRHTVREPMPCAYRWKWIENYWKSYKKITQAKIRNLQLTLPATQTITKMEIPGRWPWRLHYVMKRKHLRDRTHKQLPPGKKINLKNDATISHRRYLPKIRLHKIREFCPISQAIKTRVSLNPWRAPNTRWT